MVSKYLTPKKVYDAMTRVTSLDLVVLKWSLRRFTELSCSAECIKASYLKIKVSNLPRGHVLQNMSKISDILPGASTLLGCVSHLMSGWQVVVEATPLARRRVRTKFKPP